MSYKAAMRSAGSFVSSFRIMTILRVTVPLSRDSAKADVVGLRWVRSVAGVWRGGYGSCRKREAEDRAKEELAALKATRCMSHQLADSNGADVA